MEERDPLYELHKALERINRLESQIRNMEAEPIPSEVLYAFMGWLTTRDETLTLGGSSDCSRIAELTGEWIRSRELPEPREGWEKKWKKGGQDVG